MPWLAGGAELVGQAGEVLPQATALLELQVEHVGGAGIGGADEQEGRGGAVEVGLEAVAAEERVDGDGVTGGEGLRVDGGGDGDVAALAVEDHQQVVGVRVLDGGGERGPARGAEALEAGELRLDGDERRGRGLDDGAAVLGEIVTPEAVGMRVEAADDLRLALRHRRGEAVAEVRGGHGCACRAPLTAPGVREVLLDGLLEARAGGEARDLRRRDLHRLTGTRVATLTGAALRDVELAETGEGDLATTLQRALDRAEHGVDRCPGVLLGKARLRRHCVNELRLAHLFESSFSGWTGSWQATTLTTPSDGSVGPNPHRNRKQREKPPFQVPAMTSFRAL